MTDTSSYTPPPVWQWDKSAGGTNRPIAGATHDKTLPVGKHSLQLHSMATPNGIKVTVMLEELLELGIAEAEYDAYLINIGDGDQFGSGFVALNPNSKIPRARRSQHIAAHPGVRIGRDPRLPRGEIRRFPADRSQRSRRVPVLAVLSDGQCPVHRRGLRPLLCLQRGENRVLHQSFRHGDENACSTCSTGVWPRTGFCAATSTRLPTSPTTAGTARSCCTTSTTPRSSSMSPHTRTWCVGPAKSRRAPQCSAAGGSTGPGGRKKNRCRNVMVPRTSSNRPEDRACRALFWGP